MLFCYCIVFPQNHITINDILINGNIITKSEIIQRELSFNKGGGYNLDVLDAKITESTENLQNLELFNFIIR